MLNPALVPWLRIGWMTDASPLWLCMVGSKAVSGGLIVVYTDSSSSGGRINDSLVVPQ